MTQTPQEPRQRILIVGNLGYLGPVLVRHLKSLDSSCYLIGLDTGYFAGSLIDPYVSFDQLLDEQIYADIRTADQNNLPHVDSIIYLAAISNDPMGNLYENPTSEINCKSAIRIANYYKSQNSASFVYASSCSVYGAGADSPRNETDLLNPLTAYARSKIDAEAGLKEVASSKLSVTCLRFATACGPSPRLRLDLVLNDFVASGFINKEIEILSDGTSWRPLIDTEDMCRAISWAKDRSAETDPFLAVNVGFDSWNYRILELARAVSKELKGVEVRVNQNATPDKRSYRVDFSLYRRLAPSNQISKSLEVTINELIDIIHLSGFNKKDFRESHLIRLNTLKMLRSRNLIDESLFWTRS